MSRSPSEVIATWKGGKLTYMELENLTQRRYLISEFLNRLRMTGAQRLIEEGGNPMMPSVPDFRAQQGPPRTKRCRLEVINDPNSGGPRQKSGNHHQ